MQLTNFEQQLNPRIVQRGRTYYKEGHVQSLEQISETNWQAEVAGAAMYIVDLVIEEDFVAYADCDCPYEQICKHIVATLYKVKEQPQQPALNSIKTPTLKALLKEQSKQQLIELILTIGKNHRDFLRELELELQPAENELALAEKIIQQHLQAAQNRQGFIPCGQISAAVTGIERIQERIVQHMENENSEAALELASLCLRSSIEAIEYSEDSQGDFSGNAEYTIDLVHQVIACNDEDAMRKKQIFCLVEDMIFSESLEQWETWQLDLLEACIPLCDNSACEQQFMTIAALLERKYQSKWHAEYTIERLRKLKQELKNMHMTDEEAEQFLQQHPKEGTLRERLIESALAKEQYEKAAHLAEQGIQVAGRGDFHWKEYAFLAQKGLNNQPEMIKLATDLLLMNRTEYYEQLQVLYSQEQWPQQRELLLDALKENNSYLYSHLIIEKQQIARILAYCQDHPHRIVDDSSHLVGIYDREVIELFTKVIKEAAQMANNRSQYQGVAQLLAKMNLAGYENEVMVIMESLRFQYSRRSAFMDELRKIKWS